MAKPHQIPVSENGKAFIRPETKSFLEGMESLRRQGNPVSCRNGGSGVCKVQVMEGEFSARVMSRVHASEDEQANGLALACRTRPCSNLVLKVLGPMRKALCR